MEVRQESDLVPARHLARNFARDVGLRLVDETKLVTAVSELTRNIIVHGGGGTMLIQVVESADGKVGVRVQFDDEGPGIVNLSQAMTDGFSTINSLGLGLPGSRRLVDEFEIESEPGHGTHVIITKWK